MFFFIVDGYLKNSLISKFFRWISSRVVVGKRVSLVFWL